MTKLNNKSGFTLIEIIVVLIIVGILAAIALPNLFSNIQKSKAGQALSTMDSFKTPLEAYYTSNSSRTPVNGDLAALSLASPTGWTISIPAAQVQNATLGTTVAPNGDYIGTNLVYSIQAADAGSNTVTLTRNTGGNWSCSVGTNSPYTGEC